MSMGTQNSAPNRHDQPSLRGQGERPADWDALREDVGEIAENAAERGRSFVDAARSQATEYVDRRKNDAAQSVVDLAKALRESSSGFEDRPNIRAFFDSAAGGLEQLAGTIQERSFADIYDDLETLMRRRPASVAAATFVAGFLVSRFIKASAETIRNQTAQQRSGAGPGGLHAGARAGTGHGGQHAGAQAGI